MNFDLNIENYTRDELIQMFELPNNFDKNIVDIKETKLREGIMNNKEINKDTQIKTLNFLLKAKNIILNEYANKPSGRLQEKIEDFYNSSYELKSTKLKIMKNICFKLDKKNLIYLHFQVSFFLVLLIHLKNEQLKKI